MLRVHFVGIHERTGVLIGLLVRSLIKRIGKGSRGACNEQGGEDKELHDCVLDVRDLLVRIKFLKMVCELR